MAHLGRGPMARGRGAVPPPPLRGGSRPPPQQIMPAPQGYYEPPPPQQQQPPPGTHSRPITPRPRTPSLQTNPYHPPPGHHPLPPGAGGGNPFHRGGGGVGRMPVGGGRPGAPPLSHHHTHPGTYAATEPGYDMDSGEDHTPESGNSPEGSELTLGPSPGPHGYGGGGYPPPPPPGRGVPPPQYFDSPGLIAENTHLRQEVAVLRQRVNEMAAGNEVARWDPAMAAQLEVKDFEITGLHTQMQEMMTANQSEITKLTESLKAAESKLKEESEKREKEVKTLKDDLDDVTAYLSVAKAEEGVVDDAWFKEELTKFATQLRNWVWKHCKAASQMPEMVQDIGIQARIGHAVPEFARLTMSNSRMTVMQAVVQDIILRRIFDRYCVGLQEGQEAAMRGIEVMLTQHSITVPPNYGMINRWRALSIALLTNTHPVKDNSESAIVDCCSEVESVVFSLIPGHKARPGDAASRALIPLLANAVRISHHFKGQRARIDVVSPVGHIFDPEWMEDASGMEDDVDEDLRGKMVGACAFPAVIKWGNEKGDDYGLRTIIFRAKVLCLLDTD
ncbi:hypothetical protein TWF703_008849 [Orbilia oligospora]|uniref:Uncharacterized protein n=1 Tax=Orbilia oligospora TaxID=2813651 RepID=A0A7C8NV10_ORBOL|nr:hypothetical protein TWF703_008849 [Orbilia oligospora]